MDKKPALGPIDTDANVDATITKCLDPNKPTSFFLYAGAGSGKTYSLEVALKKFSDNHRERFLRNGQRIAVITFTNDARDEIMSRVAKRHGENDTLFVISTIHSFCWSLIQNFHTDIQRWYREKIPAEIAELEEKQRKGRAGQASIDRARSIEQKSAMLEWLEIPREFTYNPNGINSGKASLSHADVLKITADFISNKPSMQVAFTNQFPFLLIDESQDTSKVLIDAFFELEHRNHEHFALGLFGDMMQRIYADGQPNLGKSIPERWETPIKKMNHRSAQRIVELGNSIRRDRDSIDQDQMARDDSEVGVVRLFVADSATADRLKTEASVRKKMSVYCSDSLWIDNRIAQYAIPQTVKSLTLEHHMAAARMEFEDVFDALDKNSSLSTGLRDGTLAGVAFFSKIIQPMIEAHEQDSSFAVMSHLRNNKCPLLDVQKLQCSPFANKPLKPIQDAISDIISLDLSNSSTRFIDVLRLVAKHNLFSVPESLQPFVHTQEESDHLAIESADPKSTLAAWRRFLEAPYSQILPYSRYVANEGEFGTHQGVKGLEYERVLVVLDDYTARGFLFNYEKVFGAKELSASDNKKIAQGEETGIDRTTRLLYVTCTRAEKSLALIAYTENPDALIAGAIKRGWFQSTEIEKL